MANLQTVELPTADRPSVRYGVPLTLLAAAGIGWWWSARMADDMGADAMGIMDMYAKSGHLPVGRTVGYDA